jgi:hypothetical protein
MLGLFGSAADSTLTGFGDHEWIGFNFYSVFLMAEMKLEISAKMALVLERNGNSHYESAFDCYTYQASSQAAKSPQKQTT